MQVRAERARGIPRATPSWSLRSGGLAQRGVGAGWARGCGVGAGPGAERGGDGVCGKAGAGLTGGCWRVSAPFQSGPPRPGSHRQAQGRRGRPGAAWYPRRAGGAPGGAGSGTGGRRMLCLPPPHAPSIKGGSSLTLRKLHREAGGEKHAPSTHSARIFKKFFNSVTRSSKLPFRS